MSHRSVSPGRNNEPLAIGAIAAAFALVSCGAPETDARAGAGGAPPAPQPPACGATDQETLAACVQDDRYLGRLTELAVPRWPGTAGWQAAQDRCRSELESLGFEVELVDYGTGVNVVGRLPGATLADESVVLSAHYDSVASCEGADDNASGVAGVLEAAFALSAGRFERTLVVACWDEEEAGLVGSSAFVEAHDPAAGPIVMSAVLEMIGFSTSEPGSQALPPGFGLLFPDAAAEVQANESRGDFIALIADSKAASFSDAFEAHGAALELPIARLEVPADLLDDPLLSDLQRSDHAPFWNAGVPALMITDTANFRYGGYHCGDGPDAVSRLDAAFAAKVVRSAVAAVANSLGVLPP